ncbi:MAG: efflux RND transporter periplasmic adaptor subunit [Gammaproteobacteria bacterium]|nr:efflux RND transporter periplasmic adaptor subunit [Gammaproteobacteria bacterium]
MRNSPRAVLALITLLLLTGCGGKAPPAAGPGRIVNITTAAAARSSVEETEWAVARIESRAAPPVAAEVAGRIVRILVDEGQTVEKGQVLAELDSQQYRLGKTIDQAEVGRLRAQADNKRREYERAKRLKTENLISEEQIGTIASELSALDEQVRGAEARAADSTRRLGDARIVAPFTGQVAKRNVDVGAYVQVGTAVFEFVDVENLRVRLPFPEYLAPQLKPGLEVRLTSAASGPGIVTAAINEIQPDINPANRSLSVIVDFTNPGDWRPGASVRADVVLQRRPDAIMVPQVALVRRPSGDVVYVVEEQLVREQPVRRGERNGALVEIVEGLKGGETVAVDGAGFLTNGAGISVVED